MERVESRVCDLKMKNIPSWRKVPSMKCPHFIEKRNRQCKNTAKENGYCRFHAPVAPVEIPKDCGKRGCHEILKNGEYCKLKSTCGKMCYKHEVRVVVKKVVEKVVEEKVKEKVPEDCMICYDPMHSMVKLNGCTHSLCESCALELASTNKKLCPMCRAPFTVESFTLEQKRKIRQPIQPLLMPSFLFDILLRMPEEEIEGFMREWEHAPRFGL